MSLRACGECNQPGSLTTCNFCQKGICANCFENHIDSHSFVTQVDSQGRKVKVPIPFCCFDSNPAKWISADFSYVCEAHSKDIEVFPLDQAQVLIEYREQGIEILRRAKKIEQVCAFLQEVPTQLERKLLESVERDYEAVISAIARAKSDFMVEIQKQIAEFRTDLSKILGLLEAQKLQLEVTASTQLEEMVFAFPLEELMESLHAEEWFRYTCDRELAKNIQKYYLGLRRSEILLCKPFKECAWKDDYYCLPGRPFKIFSLVDEKVCFCDVQINYTSELTWTIVPDGSFFFCGDMISTTCRLLDSNYSEYKRIGELVIVRANPGIIHFEGAIYIFGGRNLNIPMKSIEAFNLRTLKSAILPVETQAPRSHFCPCVWNRQIFLGSDFCTCILEAFDPICNLCKVVNAELLPIPSVLVAVSEEEIVIMAGDITSYFPNRMQGTQVGKGEFGLYTPGGVVTRNGKAYFAPVSSKFWRVCCLEENYKVREITKVFD